MYLKIHEKEMRRIVAVCDEELIGKVFKDKKSYLDLDKYRNFYVGEKADEEKVKDALKGFTSANLVGKKSVNVAIHMGLVNNSDVMYIKKVPYIQIYQL